MNGKMLGVFIRSPKDLEIYREQPDFLVIGEEFCQRLLPEASEFEELLNLAAAPVLSFVTPPVTGEGLKRLEKLFDILVQVRPDAEVVVNDWGVDHLLEELSAPFPKTVGRLLNKQRTDPRSTPPVSHIESWIFQDYLAKRGYVRIEWSPRWSAGEEFTHLLPGTLHWPDILVLWTRSCLAANLTANPEGTSSIGVIQCHKPCRKLNITVDKKGFPLKWNIAGNVVLYEANELPPDPEKKNINRVVLNMRGRQ